MFHENLYYLCADFLKTIVSVLLTTTVQNIHYSSGMWFPPSPSLQLFSATVVTFCRCKGKRSSGLTSLDSITLIFYSVTPVLNAKIEFCLSASFKRHPVWIWRHEEVQNPPLLVSGFNSFFCVALKKWVWDWRIKTAEDVIREQQLKIKVFQQIFLWPARETLF